MNVRGENPKTKTCPDCGGKGDRDIPIQDGDQLRIMKEKCRTCYGTGRVPDNDNGDDDDRGLKLI